MHRLGCFLVLVSFALIGLVVAPSGAVAQSNADIAQGWGLLGTWRLDCGRPRSRENPDLKYVVRGGKLFHDRDFGDATDSQPVIAATPRPDNALELVVRFNGFSQTRQFIFVHGDSGTLRTVYNRDVDSGSQSITDGKFTANGEPAPWQYHCN